MRSIRVAIALALLAGPQAALAYRPFDSTDAAVADPGVVEVELGPLAYTDLPSGSITELPLMTVNVGVAFGWETVIDAERAIARSPRAHDIETVETALLLKRIVRDGVLHEQAGWSIATEFGVLLPTVNGDDDYGATWALIGSRGIGRTMVHVNATLAQNRDGNTELVSGLIVEDLASSPVRPVAELTLQYERGTDARSGGALVGAIWERGENLSFDMAVRAVRDEQAWSYEGRVGLTWVFASARK
jgi:hypothetical protein